MVDTYRGNAPLVNGHDLQDYLTQQGSHLKGHQTRRQQGTLHHLGSWAKIFGRSQICLSADACAYLYVNLHV